MYGWLGLGLVRVALFTKFLTGISMSWLGVGCGVWVDYLIKTAAAAGI